MDELYLWSDDELKCLDRIPWTSATVERAFSVYKAMNRENRQSFTFEHFRKYYIIKCILTKVIASSRNSVFLDTNLEAIIRLFTLAAFTKRRWVPKRSHC